jgi:hypothetical protein
MRQQKATLFGDEGDDETQREVQDRSDRNDEKRTESRMAAAAVGTLFQASFDSEQPEAKRQQADPCEVPQSDGSEQRAARLEKSE